MFAYCNNNPSNYVDVDGKIAIFASYNDAVATAQELMAADGPYPIGDAAATVVLVYAGVVWVVDNWEQIVNDINNAANQAYEATATWFARKEKNSSNGSNYTPMGHSNGNSPRNNKDQNSQFRWIIRKLNLTKDQARRLHNEITGQGYGYQEIIEIAKSMFNIM